MLSKLYANTFKQLTFLGSKPFSVRRAFFDFIYRDDASSSNQIATSWCPKSPLQGHEAKTRAETARNWEQTKLSNGITVLTESTGFPNKVDFGFLLNVGTRDETTETSGSLLSIQNTYLKTIMNTNETINYGIVQMSGGSFEMEYDQETTYFQASCLQHDVVDVFNMVADCALEPRSVLAAQVGQSKNEDSHKLDAFLKTGEGFNENVFKTAFGLKGLGLPRKGLKGNVSNLTSHTLQKFQIENITPDRIFVVGAGVDSHAEFVDLVQEKVGHIPAVDGKATRTRTATEYVGGEVRNLTEDSELAVATFFQSTPYSGADYGSFILANHVLNRRLDALLKKNAFLDQAKCYNFTFSDSGLFGIKLIGAASHSQEIFDTTVSQLKKLSEPISEAELQGAKSFLKVNAFLALQRQNVRLEEAAKNVLFFGKVTFQDYGSQIDAITSDNINKAVSGIFGGNPTFVAQGGNANRLPAFDQIRNAFK